MDFQFLGAVVDRFFGLHYRSITGILKFYRVVIISIYRIGRRQKWRRDEIQLVSKSFRDLKISVLEVHLNSQPSEMGIIKVCFLEHLT